MASQQRKISLALAKKFREFQDYPELVFMLGLIKLNSSFQVDDNGDVLPNAGGMSLFNTYRPTRIQKLMDRFRYLCRETNHETFGTILKARDVGGSVNISVWDVCRVVTLSGAKALTVAHQPTPAQNIFEMKRKMEASLPEWMRPLDRPGRIKDSAEARDIEIPHFGIHGSRITCVPATSIDAVRSDRYLHMHFSEASRFECASKVREAIGSLAVTVPKGERWRLSRWDESTANGEDGFFDVRFREAWSSQGERNFWEDGCKLFRTSTTAMFFPFYMETNKKILDFHPDVTWRDLYDELDDTEKGLFHKHIFPYWLTMFPGEDEFCREHALKQLNWRRAKIPSAYPNWPVTGAGSTYGSPGEFWVEEPATPEEAFSKRDNEPVFSPAFRASIAETVQDPIAKGLCVDGRWSDVGTYVWLWKRPEDTSYNLSLGADFAPGSDEGRSDPFALDSTYAVLFDRDSGEQVAEYVSQEPDYVAALHILDLLRYFRRPDSERKVHDDPASWPFVAPERPYGQNFIRILRESGFPASRIYRHVTPGVLGSGVSKGLGFNPNMSNSQGNAIATWLQMLSEGQRIIRSERLLRETNFLVRKGPNKIEAQNKSKGGPSSKDDGMWACAIEAFAETNSSRPVPASIVKVHKGAGERVYADDAPDISSENITEWVEWRKKVMDQQERGESLAYRQNSQIRPKKVFMC